MVSANGKKTVTFIRGSDPDSDDLPETFVDRYSKWASTCTDAPVQYHRATGVTILSTLMTPHLSLRTSFGTIVPNIWMMVLAGTTMTRKSTSLDIARRLLDDVTDDYMLATDGSPEGLLTELAYRDGKVSLFHRDEVTGFMSQVSGRDYMSGLLESFTRLYDGQPETRLLRREKIEIKKPYLIFMSGGIKSKMQEIVGMEHIRSGFLPRFIFVTGSTTREEVRAIDFPDDDEYDEDNARSKILDELYEVSRFYTEPVDDQGGSALVKIAGITKVAGKPKPKFIKLKVTEEFKRRVRQLNDDAIAMGESSSAPELYTPLYTRLSNSIIKVSMLLAGAEMRSVVELRDLQKAIHLGQEWLEAVTEFASAIEAQPEMDKWERKAEKIVQWVKNQDPEPLTQTQIMQKFRIRKRDIKDIEATLMARGMVQISPYPHSDNMSGGQITYTLPGRNLTLATRPPTKIDKEDTYHAEGKGYTDSNGNRPARVKIRGQAVT